MRFTFVPDLDTAIDQARAAATDGDVLTVGGGDSIGQALERGMVGEIPMVVCGGTPLLRAGARPAVSPTRCPPVEQRCHLAYERLTDE